MMITGKLYDVLKWLARFGLPGLIALATAGLTSLSPLIGDVTIWVGVVDGLLGALITALNIWLGISKNQYQAQLAEADPALPDAETV
jgi:hypothetical protein